jgi:hypothetical protein
MVHVLILYQLFCTKERVEILQHDELFISIINYNVNAARNKIEIYFMLKDLFVIPLFAYVYSSIKSPLLTNSS